jgi:predicted AAA+ superfamily ATPase
MERLVAGWNQASIVWLTGPRRVGKTILARSLPDAEFFNCDLPGVAERLRDPESFYRSAKKRRIVLDEVHQLPDPSRLLKIGADEFPHLQILATGSSTLAATSKFRDSLTGRKRVVTLVPVLPEELPAFGVADVRERLLRGGLPPALLAEKPNPEFFGEWLDSYFARDVQELFRLEKRAGFLRLLELLFRQSGGMLDMTKLASESQVSRPTVANWLEVYQTTHVTHLIRPFSAGGRREIVGQPKVFGFDTGLVCYARGWDQLRTEDCGALWEHLVLDTLIAAGLPRIHFWRDKQHREVDFVIPRGREVVDAIECKWQADAFETRGLSAFRGLYPKGRNYLVSPLNGPGYERVQEGHRLVVVSPGELRRMMD